MKNNNVARRVSAPKNNNMKVVKGMIALSKRMDRIEKTCTCE